MSDDRAHPTRRRVLLTGAGAVAVLAAGGAGVAAGYAQPAGRTGRTARRVPPAALRAALDDELTLLEQASSVTGVDAATKDRLVADHREHAAALRALVLAATVPQPSPTSYSLSIIRDVTAAQLTTLESAAATRAAGQAAALTGQAATLLATIAACEATHVVVLQAG